MTFAVSDRKNPAATWGEAQSQRKANERKSRVIVHVRKKSDPGNKARVWTLLKHSFSISAKMLLAAICAYWIYMGYQFVITSPHFAISDVMFSGHQKLDEKDLLATTGPLKGQNIFLLDAGEISQKLAAHPWIQDVSIQRMFPRRLEITVSERVPFARIKLDHVYIMDKFGVLISDDRDEYGGLPLITGPVGKKPELGQNAATAGVIRGLKTMHSFNRLPFFKNDPVYAARIEPGSRIAFLTKASDLQVIMGLETLLKDFKKLLIVLDMIGKSADQIEYIDLSFKDQVVVKPRKGSGLTANHSQAKTLGGKG